MSESTSQRARAWLIAHPHWALTFATVLALLPFLAKPFNIDDPLFLWAAKQIQLHPADPYGFKVEWGWTAYPMWDVTENPPFTCYYLAVATAILGWSEFAVHFALLLPAIAVVLGTYRLAKNYCRHPFFAALIALFTPVFLISANTVMCDVSMLAFWVWAIVLWVEGLPSNARGKLALAGVFIGLATLTKYYGACLLPLLGAYAIVQRRPLRCWAQLLIIPLAMILLYQWLMLRYGYMLFLATDYATFSHGFFGVDNVQNAICGLAFTGGCVAPIIFFAGLLWKKNGLLFLGAGAAMLAAVVFLNHAIFKNYAAIPADSLPSIRAQSVLWATAGIAILALTLWNLWQKRNSNALLLTLWVGGTFVFATFCNWTVNARSILPMAPAVAILITQQLETNRHRALTDISKGAWLALVLCGIFTLYTETADFSGAIAARNSVDMVLEKYARAPGNLWYEGHWGFQFYMNEAGALAMDFKHLAQQPGDHIVIPANNTNLQPPDPARSEISDTFTAEIPGCLTTFNNRNGAGYYAAAMGPLPFVFAPVQPEIVHVYYLKPNTSAPKASQQLR